MKQADLRLELIIKSIIKDGGLCETNLFRTFGSDD